MYHCHFDQNTKILQNKTLHDHGHINTLTLCHMRHHVVRHNGNAMPSCINVIHDIVPTFKSYLLGVLMLSSHLAWAPLSQNRAVLGLHQCWPVISFSIIPGWVGYLIFFKRLNPLIINIIVLEYPFENHRLYCWL